MIELKPGVAQPMRHALFRSSPAPNRRAGLTRRHLSSLAFLVASLASALVYLVHDHNADWLAYQYLYEEGGGWLAESKRDPAFLALADAALQVMDYDSFRVVVALYFVAFTLWLANRWRAFTTVDRHILSYLPLVPLLLPRFTVQIREGLAMTAVLLALTYLADSRRWRALALLLLASTIHLAAFTFVPLLLGPWLLRTLGRQRALVRWLFPLVSFVGLAGIIATGTASTIAHAIASSVWGDFAPMAAETSTEKGVYWALRSLVIAYLLLQARSSVSLLPLGLRGFARALVFLALPGAHIIALFLIFGGYSAYVASSALRVVSMLIGVSLALVAMPRPKTPLLLAIVAVSVADETRILLANAPINLQ